MLRHRMACSARPLWEVDVPCRHSKHVAVTPLYLPTPVGAYSWYENNLGMVQLWALAWDALTSRACLLLLQALADS